MKQLKSWGWLMLEACIGVALMHQQDIPMEYGIIIIPLLQIAGKEINKKISADKAKIINPR